MRKQWVVICMLIAVPVARGGLVAIAPEAGWSGYFYWEDGPGPLDGIQTSPYLVDWEWNHLAPWTSGEGFWGWSITLATDSVMTYVRTRDMAIPGDEFSLIVDGVTVPWTSTYKDADGYFHAEYRDLLLSNGNHIITFELTTAAPTTEWGSAAVQFSPTQFSPTKVVPIPDATWLAVIGLGTGGWLSRRRMPSSGVRIL